MLYCPPNSTLDHLWIHHGINICFLETVTSSVVGGFILIFGITQLLFYRKHATRLTDVNLPWNTMFKAQIASHIILVMIAIFNLIAHHSLKESHPLYGFEILSMLSNVVTWPLCIAVIFVERRFQLPTPPSHGHGFVLLCTWTVGFISVNLAFLSMDNTQWWFHLETLEHKVEFGFWLGRYIFTFVIFILGIKAPGISSLNDYYGRFGDSRHLIEEEQRETPGESASVGSTWRNLYKKMRTLLPYMWPRRSMGLQFRVILCVVLLVSVRVVNVFVPIMSKKIVDALAGNNGEVLFPWQLILGFIGLKLLQGGGTGSQGLLNGIRNLLWIRVSQFTEREIQLKLFSHLHGLSLKWHLGRKVGEVLRIVDRGTSSISSLLSYIVFSISPTIVDIIVAVFYFSLAFNIWFGCVVFITMVVYLSATIAVTEWRTKFRRKMNEADNNQSTRAVDSLINFEAVKLYTGETHEKNMYEKSILNYQVEEFKTMASLTLLNILQSFIINAGLLVGSVYCAYLVFTNDKSVGDYVLFGTYMVQLMQPLNWLGTLYRVIQEAFVNMENMFDLLDEPFDVKDVPNALPLMALRGKVDFRNVSFSYSPERPIIKDITFSVEPGQTFAIVGPTGAGKSTIMRLLLRFYDVTNGDIFIDNQNVRDVTQESLRKAMGVVPQDTCLFNDTIGSNIRYARMDATDLQIESAAKNADIHDRILEFPKGYDTLVGERGLKLSGGEKQRVAIARTILKSPLIVLLDEATSSLDSNTERNIQDALGKVCAERTTIIVAHRLSTIVHADCILVLEEGQIVERGRHEELLQHNALYATMWNQQSQSKTVEQNTDGVDQESKA